MNPLPNDNTLLFYTLAICATIIIVLFVVCAVVIVVFVRLLRKNRPDPPQNLYAEVGDLNPLYEMMDKNLRCFTTNVSKSETDLSYVDMCGAIAPDPLYDTADSATTQIDTKMATKQLEAEDETPTLDKTLEEETSFNLTHNDFHYQNISEEYSHYGNVPHATRQNACVKKSIYED